MSGHSKWATIKHKKGALDAKRGKIFTRLIKEISMAAKNGGDVEKNPRLRTAVAAAKAENMPADNIKRAIQRGTGELPGVTYEEITFEGYGPGGVAILVEVSTDNRNRTVSEIRHAFSKNGGNLGAAGSVAYMFHKKGDIVIAKSAAKEDDLMNIVLEAGAEDLRDDGENWEILTDPASYETVLEAVKKAGTSGIKIAASTRPSATSPVRRRSCRSLATKASAKSRFEDVRCLTMVRFAHFHEQIRPVASERIWTASSGARSGSRVAHILCGAINQVPVQQVLTFRRSGSDGSTFVTNNKPPGATWP